ncbi:MAG: hypothetical protein OEY59_04775 [Deltaproteobacteria bacterium]|nr:hypothetical protein [Deltaproteobacteria bacterium]
MEKQWDFELIKRNVEGFLELSKAESIKTILKDSYEQLTLTVLETGAKDIENITEALLSLGELRHIIKLNYTGDPNINLDKIFRELLRIIQNELNAQSKDIFGVPDIKTGETKES